MDISLEAHHGPTEGGRVAWTSGVLLDSGGKDPSPVRELPIIIQQECELEPELEVSGFPIAS